MISEGGPGEAQATAVEAGEATAVAALRHGVDLLLGLDPERLSGPELLELLAAVEVQVRRLPAVDHRLVAGADRRGLAGERACPSTAALLGQLLNLTPGEAKGRVIAARELAERRDLAGIVLPPLFPAVAAAQAAGSLSAAHARVITSLLDSLPAEVDAAFGAQLQACLVQHATHLDPACLARAGQRLRARLDPDGPEPKDRDHQRRRAVSLRTNADGSSEVSGHLTAAATAVWDAILDCLAAPIPADGAQPDDRTPAQRRHDALLDAGLRLLRSGTLPDCGGTPTTVTVTVQARDLHTATRGVGRNCADCGDWADGDTWRAGATGGVSRQGYATTSHGELLSIPELLTLAAEAEIIPVVLNDAGGVMAYGRTRRLATPAQRRALAARDLGCSFPGCTRPPAWCSAHHITAWIDGGPTDLNNLTLLCGYHHRDFERRGWTCTMINGVPHWTPPAWLDATQTPRRNTAHHLEITFDADPSRPDNPQPQQRYEPIRC